MFFIIAEYFENIFQFTLQKKKLAPITPINDRDSYYVNVKGYSTLEELYDLV